MADSANGDKPGKNWEIGEVEDEDPDVEVEEAGVVPDWEPLDDWLKRETQEAVTGWFRQNALLLAALAIIGVSWERILAIGVIMQLPVLEAVALLLGLPRTVFNLTSRMGRMNAFRTSATRPRASQKRT